MRNAILRSKKLNNSASDKSLEVIKVPAQKKSLTIKADENLTTDKSDQQKKHGFRRVKSTREALDQKGVKEKDDLQESYHLVKKLHFWNG